MNYQIGHFIFKINYHDPIPIPHNMTLFETTKPHYDYLYDIYVVDHIEVIEDTFILSTDKIKIVQQGSLHKRYLYLSNDGCPYALCIRMHEGHTTVYIHQRYLPMFISDPMFVSILSLEKRLYPFNQYILHSNYLLYNNQAILFSAPSGVGKSTQADLWVKYRHAHIVNGDRTLLSKENNTYYANGWPVCGSSNICHNEKHSIRAIVLLQQGSTNSIIKPNYATQFKKLMAEITINYHNNLFVNQAMDFIDDMIQHLDIVLLTCDISEDAVICLENYLFNSDAL